MASTIEHIGYIEKQIIERMLYAICHFLNQYKSFNLHYMNTQHQLSLRKIEILDNAQYITFIKIILFNFF